MLSLHLYDPWNFLNNDLQKFVCVKKTIPLDNQSITKFSGEGVHKFGIMVCQELVSMNFVLLV